MRLRTAIARAGGLTCAWGLRVVLGRRGSSLPGRIALNVDRDLIGELSHKCLSGSIVVCGTNGKTTTNNLIAQAMTSAGLRVLCNYDGANMASGVACALLPGKECDWGVFEVDELSTARIVPWLKPRYFLLVNLFRDQLDRAGEIDRVQDVIVNALLESAGTVLIYNGDDPLCEGVATRVRGRGMRTLAFGIEDDLGMAADRVTDGAFCQVCGAPLTYSYRLYGQLGEYRCLRPGCTFGRPRLEFAARDVVADESGVSLSVLLSGDEVRARDQEGNACGQDPMAQKPWRLHARRGGVYMAYNLLAAASVASLVGVDESTFETTVDEFNPGNGRLQQFVVDGCTVTLNLAKNPTGFNQNIALLASDASPKSVYVVINDDYNDGRDVSWLWDVDFERVGEVGLTACFVGGHRANDMQVRMKYAGIEGRIAKSVSEVLARLSEEQRSESLYVLTNYSALWPAKAELESLVAGK